MTSHYSCNGNPTKGLDHNFTMFFQLKLFRIAQTPHTPSSILNEENVLKLLYMFFYLKMAGPPSPILKDLG